MKRFIAVPGSLALLALLASLPAAAPAAGQSSDTTLGRIVGRIVDGESGRPIVGVSLALEPGHRRQISGRAGEFLFAAVPRGIYDLHIEHLAYGRSVRPVNVPGGETVEVQLRLLPRAVALDSIVVAVTIRNPLMERSGYYRRKRAGWGYYMEGQQLQRVFVTDIVRDAPRVEVLTGLSTLDRHVRMRVLTKFGPGYCTPEVYIDGLQFAAGADMLDESILPQDLQAIEIYHGIDTPLEFLHNLERPCGAIALWTKR